MISSFDKFRWFVIKLLGGTMATFPILKWESSNTVKFGYRTFIKRKGEWETYGDGDNIKESVDNAALYAGIRPDQNTIWSQYGVVKNELQAN